MHIGLIVFKCYIAYISGMQGWKRSELESKLVVEC